TANYVNEIDLTQGYGAGAVDYIIKPIKKYILLSKVRVFLDLFGQKQTIMQNALKLKETAEELAGMNDALQRSETRLSNLLFTIVDWVWEIDNRGMYTYSSQNGTDFLGLTPDEIIGKTPYDFMTPEEVVRLKPFLSEIFKNREPIKNLENWNITKDGHKICLLTNGLPIFDKEGVFAGYQGINKNITEHKQDEEEIKQQSGLISSLLDCIPDLVFYKNLDGVYMGGNPTFAEFAGISKDEIIGKTDYDLFGSEVGDFFRFHDTEMLKQGKSRYNEEWVVYPDGREVLLETIKTPYRHSDGSLIGILGVSRDITQRKQAEDLLQQTHQNYETFFNTIDDFLFVMDENGNILYTNNTVIDRLGYTKEELIGHPILMLHPLERQEEARLIVGDMLMKKAESCLVPLLTKSGLQIPVETKINHGVWDGETVIFGVIKDISQIKLSEEKFSKVFYLNPSACGLTDLATGSYIEVNDAFCTLFGFEKNEVIGKTPVELNIMTREAIGVVMQHKNKNEAIKNAEAELKSKNGEIKHVILSAENIIVQDKKYRYTVVHDITRRIIAEKRIKASEEKYKTMLNASPDVILLTNLKGLITDISDIGLELFGISNLNDIVGKHFFQFIPHEERAVLNEILAKTLNEGISQNTEMKIKKMNQSIFLSEISSTLIQGSGGIPFSFMMIIRDISQRKKLESKQIHADRMASLGEMASGIAHEIMQPLNTMSFVLDNVVFQASKVENIEKEYLKKKTDKIFENITRIRTIIDHIRAFSQSRDNYILTNFDVNLSIRNALSMISEQFKHLAIDLNMSLGENLPTVIGNSFQFEQVILNLLINAKDALLEKKAKIAESFDMFVEIRTLLENGCIVIEIADNGPGINKNDMEHIMLPFYTTKETGKGTGLGLSISYQIIKEMNGSIEVLNNIYHGATFQIILEIQSKV
ncbi:MAG: PAS domain S-box protein, partial [Bacteroidales bacterium]|nr:PAS domain S-box protein [Bacteroidales bacterium]